MLAVTTPTGLVRVAAVDSAPRICCAAKVACSRESGGGYWVLDSSSSGSTCMIEPSLSSVSSAAASGSLASNTWNALLKNATVGTDNSAPTGPASTPPVEIATTTASG